MFNQNGFIRAEALQSFAASGNNHTIRLVHDYLYWHGYVSFFGGRVGAYVQFEGPTNETWKTADIIIPINEKGKDWKISTHENVMHPADVHVEWHNHIAIMPSLKVTSFSSITKTEQAPVRAKT